MQINRLFEIIYILLNKKIVTSKELSNHFEVSQRTIYRDIEILCQSGIPIYTSRGKGGGISLLNNFILNKSLISKQEQNEIISSLEGLNALKYPDLESIISKLNTFFGNQNSNWIEVDFSDWDDKHKELFSLIKFSILNKNVINFDYYNSYGEKSYKTVEPLKLWFKKNSWYLKAFCAIKQKVLTFKITRIRNLNLTEQKFERTIVEDVTNNVEVKNTVLVKLHIDISQAYRIYDEFEEKEIYKEDNYFIITKEFIENQWLYGYILTFGEYVKILEPKHIKEILKVKLRNMIYNYDI